MAVPRQAAQPLDNGIVARLFHAAIDGLLENRQIDILEPRLMLRPLQQIEVIVIIKAPRIFPLGVVAIDQQLVYRGMPERVHHHRTTTPIIPVDHVFNSDMGIKQGYDVGHLEMTLPSSSHMNAALPNPAALRCSAPLGVLQRLDKLIDIGADVFDLEFLPILWSLSLSSCISMSRSAALSNPAILRISFL